MFCKVSSSALALSLFRKFASGQLRDTPLTSSLTRHQWILLVVAWVSPPTGSPSSPLSLSLSSQLVKARRGAFFESYLAAPVAVLFYVVWKVKTRSQTGKWQLMIEAEEMDVVSGCRKGGLKGRYHDPERAKQPIGRRALGGLF